MLLFASSPQAAGDIVAALGSAGFEVSLQPEYGTKAVFAEAAGDRKAEVLDIAKAADPDVRVR